METDVHDMIHHNTKQSYIRMYGVKKKKGLNGLAKKEAFSVEINQQECLFVSL